MKALEKINVSWHAEAAKLLRENFGKIHTAFTDATKRAVWMGMFLNHIKAKGKEDDSIPHGEFGPWMEKNVPEIPFRTAQTYMQLATGVCETGKFEIRQFSVFAQNGQLPPQIEKLIEGKTQQQLFLDFRSDKKEAAPAGPRKKLTAAEQEAEQQKNIEACFSAAEGAITLLIQMKDQDFVRPLPAARERVADLCLRLRDKVKNLKGEKGKI